MSRESYKQEWCCVHCGGNGITELENGMHPWFVNAVLVRAHSLQSPGCDANALKSLRLRTSDMSERDWKGVKKRAKALALHADHSEDWMNKWSWLPWPF
jgi:hypothetical protein